MKNLVFLISQPRAGSTLLQRVLGGHSEIFTAGEPWLMLPLLYVLKDGTWEAEYSSRTFREAFTGFMKVLPGGEEDYLTGVRRLALHVYERAAAPSGRSLYLDKTPRYYAIIPELARTFPDARFVLLLRHPLGVLHSITRTWCYDDLFGLRRYAQDLAHAPGLLAAGARHLGERCVVVHYEKLVADPPAEVARICSHLGVAFEPAMIEYGNTRLPHWSLGDQAVYEATRPGSASLEKWVTALSDPQAWRMARDYLELLGEPTMTALGYDHAEAMAVIDGRRPARGRLLLSLPLRALLGLPEKPGRWGLRLRRLGEALAMRGVRGAAVAAARELRR